MATELWYPIPQYLSTLKENGFFISVRELCEASGLICRFEGKSADRLVCIVRSAKPFIECTPHNGAVRIGTRYSVKSKAAKKYALAAMAYAVFDLAARESIRGIRDFNQIKIVGRPRAGRAKTNAERQREYRLRQAKS